VASVSDRVVIVVDESKLVDRLGSRGPLPVEVVQFGWRTALAGLEELGAEPTLRVTDDGEPFTTDGGHYILDCRFPSGIADAARSRRAAPLAGRRGDRPVPGYGRSGDRRWRRRRTSPPARGVTMTLKIAPSILSADFARLADGVAEAEAGAPTGSMWTSWTVISCPT
jgi:hypothetical protein